MLDVHPFEHEHCEVVAKVDAVPVQAEARWIERRARSEQIGRPFVCALPQLQRDDEPLHRPIIEDPLIGQTGLKTRPTSGHLPPTSPPACAAAARRSRRCRATRYLFRRSFGGIPLLIAHSQTIDKGK